MCGYAFFGSFFFLVFFFLFVFLTKAFDPTYVYHYCPNTTTFTRNSTYFINLRTLLSSLSSRNASYSTGFQNATAGQSPERVTGLFLCRGDVSPEACRSCVEFSVNNTLTRCPKQRVVTLYHDECILRYSDRNILSALNTDGGAILANTQNLTSNQVVRFRDLILPTMNQAVTDALTSPRKFDARKANWTAFQTVYAMAQCTPDLTTQDCLRCLQHFIDRLPIGSIGGRILLPSCYSRFELYPFYNETVLRTPPVSIPSPPPPISIPSPPPVPSPPRHHLI